MTSTEIVGPVSRTGLVAFYGGGGPDGWGPTGFVAYVPPRDTCDPRFAACQEHRVGCDCREAAHAEAIAEWRSEARALADAAETVLAGHRVRSYDGSPPCACTGCQIARAAGLHPRSAYRPPRATRYPPPF